VGGEKTPSLFEPFIYKNVIVLPRQARDKHRESTQKQTAVFSGPHRPAAVGGLRSDPKMVDRQQLAQGGRLGVRALREFLHSAPASTGDEVRQKEKTRQAF
jgi:hypothetical protein